MDVLTVEQRLIYQAVYVEQRDPKVVAARYDYKVNNVHRYLYKIRQRMKPQGVALPDLRRRYSMAS